MKTLLMVEDEDEIRVLMKLALSNHFNIIEASTGIEALTVARDCQPDLILMNVMMPEMDGFTTVQKLKMMKCTRWIPVVFVSSMATSQDIQRGYEVGAVDYITKPFNILELPRRLERALEKGVNYEEPK